MSLSSQETCPYNEEWRHVPNIDMCYYYKKYSCLCKKKKTWASCCHRISVTSVKFVEMFRFLKRLLEHMYPQYKIMFLVQKHSFWLWNKLYPTYNSTSLLQKCVPVTKLNVHIITSMSLSQRKTAQLQEAWLLQIIHYLNYRSRYKKKHS